MADRADVGLRPVGPGDDALLLEVYASTRADELSLFGWDEQTLNSFVAQQFRAQDVSWRATYPTCTRQVVMVAGEPAGRLYVDRSASRWHIVDIALQPRFRGRGVGTALLTGVVADAAGTPVTLLVERASPARRLYERLGFRIVGDEGFRVAMVRTTHQVCR